MASRDPVEVLLDRLRELVPPGEAAMIAQRAGVRPEHLSKWKTGALVPNPTLRTLTRLAKGLRVPIAYLISDGTFEPAYDPRDVERLIRAAEIQERAARDLRQAVLDAMKRL